MKTLDGKFDDKKVTTQFYIDFPGTYQRCEGIFVHLEMSEV